MERSERSVVGVFIAMNLIRIREHLPELTKANVWKPLFEEELRKAPLFEWNRTGLLGDLTPNEHAWCKENICVGPDKMAVEGFPFPQLGIVTGTLDPDIDSVIWVDAVPCFDKDWPGGPRRVFFTAVRIDKFDGKEVWTRIHHSGALESGMIVDVWSDGKLVPQESLNKKNLGIVASSTRHLLMRFVFDLNSGGNFMVEVAPKPRACKSVIWHKARTHYVLLTKGQAKQCQSERRGPSAEEVTRAAHSRRAHLRFLGSEKFTHKRGQWTKIKQTWVGPLEWEGTDDKFYKVVVR